MTRRYIPYLPHLKERARQLCNNSTTAEIILWKRLRKKQCKQTDLHRQKPLDRYIVDFYAPEIGMVIEIDGSSHDGRGAQDTARQQRLEQFGLTVLRFTDRRVKERIEGVVDTISYWIDQLRDQG